jgi:hypothetical protein
VRFLLDTELVDKRVAPVNRNPNIVDHYRRPLPASEVHSEYVGKDAVPRFVSDYAGHVDLGLEPGIMQRLASPPMISCPRTGEGTSEGATGGRS